MKTKYSTAKELRGQARKRLTNRWGIAIVAFLIAGALGIAGISLNIDVSDLNIGVGYEETFAESTDSNEVILEEYMFEEDHEAYIRNITYYAMGMALVGIIFSLIVMLCSLYAIFVGAPLQAGYMRFNLRLFKTKRDVSLNEMLYGFRNCYSHSAGTYFLTALIYIGIGLAFLLIPFAVLLAIALWAPNSVMLVLGVFVFAMGMFVWSIAMIATQLRYSMCYYILADHPEMKAREVLRESKRLMQGNRRRLFRLRLSFLGWIFLSVLSCGIGLLWVGPYMQAAETAFYRELVNGGKKQSFLAGLFGSV